VAASFTAIYSLSSRKTFRITTYYAPDSLASHSVKPENAKEILDMEDIDGVLVGGASLDPADFLEIIQAAEI
jgi:hypothetical protein